MISSSRTCVKCRITNWISMTITASKTSFPWKQTQRNVAPLNTNWGGYGNKGNNKGKTNRTNRAEIIRWNSKKESKPHRLPIFKPIFTFIKDVLFGMTSLLNEPSIDRFCTLLLPAALVAGHQTHRQLERPSKLQIGCLAQPKASSMKSLFPPVKPWSLLTKKMALTVQCLCRWALRPKLPDKIWRCHQWLIVVYNSGAFDLLVRMNNLHYIDQRQQQHFGIQSHQRHLPDRWSLCLFCNVILALLNTICKILNSGLLTFTNENAAPLQRIRPTYMQPSIGGLYRIPRIDNSKKIFPLAKMDSLFGLPKIQMPAVEVFNQKGILCYQQRTFVSTKELLLKK